MPRATKLTACVIFTAICSIAAGLIAETGQHYASAGFASAALVFLGAGLLVYLSPPHD